MLDDGIVPFSSSLSFFLFQRLLFATIQQRSTFNSKLDKRYAECWLRSFNDSFVFNCACAVQRKDGQQMKVVIKPFYCAIWKCFPPSFLRFSFLQRKFMSRVSSLLWFIVTETSTIIKSPFQPIWLRMFIKTCREDAGKSIYSWRVAQQFSESFTPKYKYILTFELQLYIIVLYRNWIWILFYIRVC